jgi:hypothetical protein
MMSELLSNSLILTSPAVTTGPPGAAVALSAVCIAMLPYPVPISGERILRLLKMFTIMIADVIGKPLQRNCAVCAVLALP